MNNIFVTGTDTDAGKSVIAALLTLGSGGQYWKPIQAGTEPTTDTKWIQEITELSSDRFFPEEYVLKTPMSPHGAAKIDGVTIELSRFKKPKTTQGRPLIVEGAGGLLVPINDKDFVIDLIRHLDCPVLLVVRSGLGTINHTLLSLEALRKRGHLIAGVVMNGPRHASNKEALERYGKVKVVAEVEPLPVLNRKHLQESFDRNLKHFVNQFFGQNAPVGVMGGELVR